MQSRISQVSGWAALSEFEHFHNLGGLGLKATKSPDEKLSKWEKVVFWVVADFQMKLIRRKARLENE